MINIKVAESNKCNGDYSLYISFEYDGKIVDCIRSFPSRYWNANTKVWELPFNKLGEFVDKLPEYEFTITAPNIKSEKPKAVVPKDFEFKTQPYEHQIVGFNFGLSHNKWLLGDEMGLGKTKQVIDIAVAKKLLYKYEHCLIICGVNGLKWNWAEEVKIHSNESAWILGQKKTVRGKTVIGSSVDKLDSLENIDKLPYFLITNVETLRYKEWTGEYKQSRNGQREKVYTYPITEKIVELCKCGKINMVAFDEIHKCKNSGSEQGSQLLKINADTMIAMTGTPLMNTPLDLYTVLKWLGYEKHSFYQFKNHHCVMGGYGGYEVVGYRNLDELQEELDAIMLRRKKEEVLDLPEKTYIDEFVEMTPKQEQIYNEVTNELRANIDKIAMSNNPLAALIRMRQATGFTGILSSTVAESAKLDRLEDLVEEAVKNGKKVVIFSNWTQMTDIAYDRLLEKGFVGQMITGDTKDENRQLIVEAFQTSKYQDFIIGTAGAMGTGLTLTAGTIEIFLDEPWNMALKEQCVDRCHRIGQNNNLTIYTLMCKGTIDERIHDIVLEKGAIANAIVDGKINRNAKEVLEFLIS